MKLNEIPWAVRGGCLSGRIGIRFRALAALGILLGLALVNAGAAGTDAPPGGGISFFTAKTRLWQGRSQVVCFQLAEPAAEDRYFPFQIDEKYLHVLIPPRVLKGETLGYLRVQPLVEGKTSIGVQGAKLDIEIAADPAFQAIAELNPRIVTPASGANVWGSFVVGVEQLGLGDPARVPPPVLLLPNGKAITGHAVPDPRATPHARWVYELNAGDLAPGANRLVAVEKNAAGAELRSNAIDVDVVRPDAAAVEAGNCRDVDSGDRPANAGRDPPKPVNDDKYGQGMVLDLTGQAWCLPVWITKPGRYQMMVTARGDFGGDAPATIGLSVDEDNQAETVSRLATTEWQRIPVGHPFTLQPGGHILSVRLRNGFSQGPDDVRSLYLQKYELANVDQPGRQLAAAGPATMMMAPPGADGAGGAAPDGLHVAFTENLDGQMVTGSVEVEAQCWWPDSDHAPPPQVELYVNRKLVSTQDAKNPRFTIDPSAFVAGANTLELRAVLASGSWAASVPLTVEVPPDFPLSKKPFHPATTFTPYNSGLASSITPPEQQNDPAIAGFYTNGVATVKVPDELVGKYKVVIDARGDEFQGPPLMSVSLKSGGKETKLKDTPVGSRMGPVTVGQVNLAPGPKELAIGFTNDAFEDGKGDRNLYVEAVNLVPDDGAPDTIPPRVSIAYAPKSCDAGSVDAVVARVLDNQRVAAVDLLIDDQPQHLDQAPLHGLGPVVLPLLTRDLKPGRHRLKVIAHDDAGNAGSSAEAAFEVSDAAASGLSKYQRAIFLSNRFGYGPEPAEIAAILTLGEKPWLQSRLTQGLAVPAEENEQEWMRAQFPNRRDGGQVVSSAVDYLLTAPNPVRARFLVWTENHFSTWINKDGAPAKGREHENFLQLGFVPFFDLLLTSATSPAMLVYLDQRESYAHRLNENYAREIMELHTLGVKGGYTQKDVTSLANLLTGWTLNDEAAEDGEGGELQRYFGYDPNLNTRDPCRVLGVEFPGVEPEQRFDRALMALELLTAHPSCATFISRKLCEQYVSDPAPPKLVADLAQVYLESGGDISAMMLAMADHPDFWSAAGRVATPIDFGVRNARIARSLNPGPVNDLISASGMGMFDRATPDGYPEDNGYSMNSNILLQRWRFAKQIQNDFLAAGLIPDAWKPADTGWTPAVTQRIIDLAAARMTGEVLTTASNDAAMKLLADAPPGTDNRLHALATFICQLPESSLR